MSRQSALLEYSSFFWVKHSNYYKTAAFIWLQIHTFLYSNWIMFLCGCNKMNEKIQKKRRKNKQVHIYIRIVPKLEMQVALTCFIHICTQYSCVFQWGEWKKKKRKKSDRALKMIIQLVLCFLSLFLCFIFLSNCFDSVEYLSGFVSRVQIPLQKLIYRKYLT